MKSYVVTCKDGYRRNAAVCSSARIRLVLDAVISLAVSICVVLLRIMMQFG